MKESIYLCAALDAMLLVVIGVAIHALIERRRESKEKQQRPWQQEMQR